VEIVVVEGVGVGLSHADEMDEVSADRVAGHWHANM
jgi:hypothetical protein